MMDDTLADESGIGVIANSDDIPVHSTPIKGTKIPLPSTRHMMKAVFEKGKPYTWSEQEISELPNVPEEKSIYSLKPVGQGHEFRHGASAESGGKQIAENEMERENKGKIVKSTEERELFSNQKVSGTHDDFKNYSDEKEKHHHLHYHPRSSSDSNTRFDPSNHDYSREDNIRTHFNSKHPRSQSADAPHNFDMRSDNAHDNDKKYDFAHQADRRSEIAYPCDFRTLIAQDKDKTPGMIHQDDRRPFTPNRSDKSSNRTNRELNYDDKTLLSERRENSPKYVQKREGQSHFKDSFHDLSPQTYLEKEASSSHKYGRGNEHKVTDGNKWKTDKTASSDLRSDVNRQTSVAHSTKDENTNAFSSYAFQSKESGKPHRHLYGDLDLTPTYKSHGRLKVRTSEISPLARRRTGSDMRGEQSGTGVRSLSTSVKQAGYSEMEVSTIQKQRQEIQLLMMELKDRDRELGDMMNSHQQQLLAWEQDRQRVITLDRKCTQYEADLQAKSTQLHNVHKAMKALKSKQTTHAEEAEINKLTVERLLRENDQLKQQLAQYQDKREMLQKTVQELSNSVGRLQAREEELNTSIKLKEKDIISATNQMKDLSDRLRLLDSRCKECQDREKDAVKEKDEWRLKYEQSATELQPLRDAVEGKSKQISQLEEELLSLRHHMSVLQKDASMREKCQEELIESMRVKQERTDSQLKNFRELYERQLRELSKLHLQLDTSKDIITKQQSSLDEQQLSGSYSIRGNSRLSDRSPDRQRTTISQTSRYRDPDPDPHISQQQSSGYQTQVSGNQSERSPDRQRNTVAQTSRYRDPDLDSHISQQQSSGYQTQVSGNQSELLETQSTATGVQLQFQPYRVNHGEESAAGNKTDNDYAKFSQDKFRPKEKNYSNDDALNRQEISPKHVRLKGVEQKPPSGKETSVKRPVSNVHGAINRSPPGPSRTAHSKPLSVLPQTKSTSCDTMQNSPPRRGGYVIEHAETDVTSTFSLPVQSHNKQDSVKVNQDEDPKMDNNNFRRSEAQSHEPYSNRQNSDNQEAFQGQEIDVEKRQKGDHLTALQGHEPGAENQYSDPYVFENRLCSFLEDMDDIDDAIWDEQGNISKVLPQGEGSNSPGSKLLNLLLESRKMIQSLEETANSPTNRQGPKPEGQGDQK